MLAERALWEGEPKLPVQPGPGVFRMLRCLVTGMEGVGADIWGAGAVKELKRVVEEEVREIVKEWVGGIAGGEKETEKVVQVLFDMLYLQRVIAGGVGLADGGLEDVVGELVRLAGMDDVTMNRMRKSAAEYWKKSYLLFALLAD